MWEGEPWLYHAHISAALNLKLLNPREVIASAEAAFHAGRAPLPAVEGFIRQVLGWREYVRGIYWQQMPTYAELNALSAQEDLPAWYWTGRTGMRCLADAISQTLQHGYAHHIQRLMVVGLYALLLGVAPKQVHAWYLSVYVDAVDWVELPNTVGMSQFADGGLAGNHLSWQWVAGTGSHKPYVFNAENVARCAPAAWHSAGSVVDQSYEALDRIAHSAQSVPGGRDSGIEEPTLQCAPPPAFTAPDARLVAGRAVQLVHPWSLGSVAPSAALHVGVVSAEFHRAWPWSGSRWHFVVTRMTELCGLLWAGDAGALRQALAAAASVDGRVDPHLTRQLDGLALQAPERLFASPRRRCTSFTQFWRQVTAGTGPACDLLQQVN
jgi:hypothetical protein